MIEAEQWVSLLYDKVEPGFYDRDKIAVMLGMSNGGNLSVRLRRLVSDGKIEEKVFRTKDAAGRLYSKPHYRIKAVTPQSCDSQPSTISA